MFKASALLVLSLGIATAVPNAQAASPLTGELIASAQSKAISFQKAEAPVTGSFSVEKKGDKTTLVFSKDFSTNPQAPALQVILVKSATPLKALKAPHYPLTPGSYTQVAALKSAKGPQTYTLPAGVDVKAYGSVLIWCKVANATMAWAPLK
ncbi:DM13 domain-containing protein [Cyanobium sp. WAJ14-Wanaka]|uniref:DM13 domain-containing protein n=1 Tax=Cyanobium sp. WAJ14-Wanaka TaxID=2823725 RepID=UPI0020CE717C|nr:DM13 domain-containing protein [Cyanobium sp. WAJ14-Wanaka]MCP9774850.1 DM13 domain-containing protein [Cyanobium sp. WAJ14-Wanaka]